MDKFYVLLMDVSFNKLKRELLHEIVCIECISGIDLIVFNKNDEKSRGVTNNLSPTVL